MWQNKEVNGELFSITTTEIYEDSSFKFHKGTTVCRLIIIIRGPQKSTSKYQYITLNKQTMGKWQVPKKVENSHPSKIGRAHV